MFCKKCGNQITPGTAFCKNCGEAVPQNNTPGMMPMPAYGGNNNGNMKNNSGNGNKQLLIIAAAAVVLLVIIIVVVVVGIMLRSNKNADKSSKNTGTVESGENSDQTVTLRSKQYEDGVETMITITLYAEDDMVRKMQYVVEYDLSDFAGEELDWMIEAVEEYFVDELQGIDGLVCKGKSSGSTYTVTMTIDCTEDEALDAINLSGLANGRDGIPLKDTQSFLKKQGFE